MKKIFLSSHWLLGFMLLLAGPALWSCSSETAYTKSLRAHDDAMKVIDEDTIQSYLKHHSISNYRRLESGLYVVPMVENPQGTPIANGKQVTAKYIGRFLSNGGYTQFPVNSVFDNSTEHHTDCGCAVFTPGNGSSVTGFDEGLRQLRSGERALLILPSRLAYGSTGKAVSASVYSIPPDAVLAFDVEILAVSQ